MAVSFEHQHLEVHQKEQSSIQVVVPSNEFNLISSISSMAGKSTSALQ
jgi:hypothetical protein